MNTRLNRFFCAAFGLVPAAVVALVSQAAPVQAQSATNSLVIVTASGAPASPALGHVFASQPAGIVKDVKKLMASGADPAVIKAFIQNWPTPYSVTADDILHLHQAGLPSEVLTAFINHAGELGARVPAAAAPHHPLPSTAPANPPAAPDAAATVPMAPTAPMAPTVGAAPPVADSYVVQPTYAVPTSTYPAYPVYDYGYYYPNYYPGISIGFGFGYAYRGHYGYGYHGGYGGHGRGFIVHGGGHGGHGGGFGGHGGGGGHR